MNRYLEKIAEFSDDDKRALKTFGIATAASIPAHALGALVGAKLGGKFLPNMAVKTPSALTKLPMIGKKLPRLTKIDKTGLGVFLGSGVAGGVTDYAAIRHGIKSGKNPHE